MTKEQYEDNLKKINLLFESKKKELIKAFCDSNNPYKIGDVFTDHISSIIIEKIKYDSGFGAYPACVYFGTVLKKDGTPKKSQEKRNAWQSNDIKLNRYE
jgi:hypothetical protein